MYKRQVLSFGIPSFGGTYRVIAKDKTSGCITAVSYTHLDVYKRQVLPLLQALALLILWSMG